MTQLETAQQRIAELEAIIAEAEKQESVGYVKIMERLMIFMPFKHISDEAQLYLHPDYASAARIKELEEKVREYYNTTKYHTQRSREFKSQLDYEKSTNTALREKLRVAREALETCTPEGFCDYDECSTALATIGDE